MTPTLAQCGCTCVSCRTKKTASTGAACTAAPRQPAGRPGNQPNTSQRTRACTAAPSWLHSKHAATNSLHRQVATPSTSAAFVTAVCSPAELPGLCQCPVLLHHMSPIIAATCADGAASTSGGSYVVPVRRGCLTSARRHRFQAGTHPCTHTRDTETTQHTRWGATSTSCTNSSNTHCPKVAGASSNKAYSRALMYMLIRPLV
jgi:hypothetical protein